MGYEWYAPKVGVVKSMVTIKQKVKEGTKSETPAYHWNPLSPEGQGRLRKDGL